MARGKKERRLFMIAFFADGERNGETIAGRRERASGKRCVCAGRIFHAIEIENELAGFVEAVGGKTRPTRSRFQSHGKSSLRIHTFFHLPAPAARQSSPHCAPRRRKTLS